MLKTIMVLSIPEVVAIMPVMKLKKLQDKKIIKRYQRCSRCSKKGYWHTRQITKQQLYYQIKQKVKKDKSVSVTNMLKKL